MPSQFVSNHQKLDISTILVPTGAESRAVKRALKTQQNAPQLIEIPAGPQAVQKFLEQWPESQRLQSPNVLVVGLAGSLSPQLQVGDGILVARCYEAESSQIYECDRALTQQLSHRLGLTMGDGVTCDRVITSIADKQDLRQRYHADIVDMESAVLLKAIAPARVAILRVVSDDCHHNLPEIGNAIGPDGTLQPGILALSFLQRPVAALQFIRGALKGLNALEHFICTLCSDPVTHWSSPHG